MTTIKYINVRKKNMKMYVWTSEKHKSMPHNSLCGPWASTQVMKLGCGSSLVQYWQSKKEMMDYAGRNSKHFTKGIIFLIMIEKRLSKILDFKREERNDLLYQQVIVYYI